eukprot:3765224-Pyramimonas_sp.AAC.1
MSGSAPTTKLVGTNEHAAVEWRARVSSSHWHQQARTGGCRHLADFEKKQEDFEGSQDKTA